MGGVDHEHVDARRDERLDPRSRSAPTPTAARAPQPPVRSSRRRVRELAALLDVLDRDQAAQAAVVVDERQLLDAVLLQERLGLVERRADRRRDETLGAS